MHTLNWDTPSLFPTFCPPDIINSIKYSNTINYIQYAPGQVNKTAQKEEKVLNLTN